MIQHSGLSVTFNVIGSISQMPSYDTINNFAFPRSSTSMHEIQSRICTTTGYLLILSFIQSYPEDMFFTKFFRMKKTHFNAFYNMYITSRHIGARDGRQILFSSSSAVPMERNKYHFYLIFVDTDLSSVSQRY